MAPARASRTATTLPSERTGEVLRPTERLRHLRVVRPHDRARRPLRLTPRAGVTMTVLLFGALFAVAGSHALLIESQGRLDRLDVQAAEEEARYERLRMDVAQMESPERILAEATAQGMVPPADLVWVSPDQPAAGTSASDAGAADEESPGTSWEEVKPYLGSTP
jgi:hypothetical protein